MNEKLIGPDCDYLFNAVLSLKTADECRAFFEDICTAGEILSIAQRLAVAKCLFSGHTNAETKDLTGAASATISRVNRSLQYGSDGYSIVIKRLEDKNNSRGEVSS